MGIGMLGGILHGCIHYYTNLQLNTCVCNSAKWGVRYHGEEVEARPEDGKFTGH